MRRPDRMILGRSGRAPCEHCMALRQRFGLDEKLAEGRVDAVGAVRRERQFSERRQFKPARPTRMIDQSDAPEFSVIFQRHRNFRQRPDSGVAAFKLGSIGGKGD